MWRVARSDDSLRMSEISAWDAAIPRAGNRFDTPDGGVLYCATTAVGCYAETLARFRPSAAVGLAAQEDDPEFVICGGVPADWRHRRVRVSVALVEPLPFLDVEAPQTHEFLTTELADRLTPLGVTVLDVAQVRGPNRLITRAIATWAFGVLNDDGFRYAGIRYMSRLGDHECWAVFQGNEVQERSRATITTSDPDLTAVADQFGLRIF